MSAKLAEGIKLLYIKRQQGIKFHWEAGEVTEAFSGQSLLYSAGLYLLFLQYESPALGTCGEGNGFNICSDD